MSSYHSSFTYLNKNSHDDYKWCIVHFDSGDSGETDSFLAVESVGTSMYDGTKTLLYGTKYSETAIMNISIMKQDGTDFTLAETRKALSWLTGAKQNSWLDLYIADEVKYRMLGHVQDVKPYKLDSRIVGLTIIFESASPYAYSSLQNVEVELNGETVVTLSNGSDDLYAYTHMNVEYKNVSGNSLVIVNNTIGEETKVVDIAVNETITLSDNMMITSDNNNRVFGSSFNFVFPRLVAGDNEFTINGNGTIAFKYIYPIKVADAIGELNIITDPICDDDFNIILDTLPFSRISDLPNNFQAYNIQNVYSKVEVDALVAGIEIDENELAAMLVEELN